MKIEIIGIKGDFDVVKNIVSTVAAAMVTEGHHIKEVKLKNAGDTRSAEISFI